MSDWAYTTLGDLVEAGRKITYGIVQPGPDVSPEGIPLIRGKDYSSGVVSTEGLYHVLPEVDEPYRRSKVKGGDLLLSIAGYVGKAAIVPDELTGANLTQTTARLGIDKNKADSIFLYHVLNSEEFNTEVKKYEKGSAQSGLNLSDVENFKVYLPNNLNQQQKIAKILSTVDNLIEKTQSLIDKYTAIKQGMMADLFTRGIDMTTGDTSNSKGGKLRPSVEDAPELYKQTELGWVPKEWEVGLLNDYLKNIEQGWSPDCDSEPANAGQWGVLKTTAVVWDGFAHGANKALPRSLTPRFEYEINVGDVLMTRAGPGNRVGVVAYVKATRPKLMLSDKLYRIVPTKRIMKEYLSILLSSEKVQRQISATKTGLAESQSNISQDIVKKLNVSLPDMGEQKSIVDQISAVFNNIDQEKVYLKKLKLQKKGLMQDLLTGKVRVNG